ncbi:MAG: hypothetical protein SNF33_05255 [Candidatus Algichlamydia australiensis]|nr:hypothetical protein [Chlamydiales bacterium]
MWNRENFKKEMSNKGIEILYWGEYGREALLDLEKELDFKFDKETRSFIEEIGNLVIGGHEIVTTGKAGGLCNCKTESKEIGLLDKKRAEKGIKIMDSSGLSYILYEDGSIKAYEHVYISPDGVVFSYDSLSKLIEEIIEEINE